MEKFSLKIFKLSQKLKNSGKKIGLCHGFLTLYTQVTIVILKKLKKCDFLFVTVTEDKFVHRSQQAS